MVTDTVTMPWTSAVTADPVPAVTAAGPESLMTGTAKTKTFTALAPGGYREADDTFGHDSDGRVTVAAACRTLNHGRLPRGHLHPDQLRGPTDSTRSHADLPAEVIVTRRPVRLPDLGPPTKAELVSDTELLRLVHLATGHVT